VDLVRPVFCGQADGMARVVQSFGVIQPPEIDQRVTLRSRVSTVDNGSSVSGGIFNLTNTIMGAALTGLPFVMSASGVVPFLAFITLSAAAGLATLWMLVDVCNYLQEGKKDFQAVGKQALGPLGLVLTACATCLSCCGALVAYIVLVGATSPVLAHLAGRDIAPWVFQFVIAFLLILPLCLLKDISGLAPSSLFAMVVFIMMAVASLGKFFIGDDYYLDACTKGELDKDRCADASGIAWLPAQMGFKEISRLPTIIMAFNCQYAMLPIYQNLRGRRQKDMNKVCVAGIATAYMIYMVVACGGYFCYKQHTLNMILLNFRHCKESCEKPGIGLAECDKKQIKMDCADDQFFFIILTGLFLLAVLLGYPCVHFAMRKAQVALIVGTDSNFHWNLHAGLAVVNIVFTLIVALCVGDHVGKVFQWTGAVASPLISFILPSMYSVNIWWQAGISTGSPKIILGLTMFVYGCAVMCLGVICNLVTLFSEET